MNTLSTISNQADVSEAFSRQSPIFDQLYDSNPIVGYMRGKIRGEILSMIKPGAHILEINAGTGTDAIFFAQQGFQVTATELSERMVAVANQKIQQLGLQDRIKFLQLSYDHIDQLEGQFDFVYSNFGGLNCRPEIQAVVKKLVSRLRSGGHGMLSILPPFTLWEKLFVLRGDFKIAFRRKKKGPSHAHIEGQHFYCWYFEPRVITEALNNELKWHQVEGMCIFSPPSFLENFPRKYPKIYKMLVDLDHKISKWPLFRHIGDYYLYTFQKN